MNRSDMTQLQLLLQKMFLERHNNYLTNRQFALDYGIPFPEVDTLIRAGREAHERLVVAYKAEQLAKAAPNYVFHKGIQYDTH